MGTQLAGVARESINRAGAQPPTAAPNALSGVKDSRLDYVVNEKTLAAVDRASSATRGLLRCGSGTTISCRMRAKPTRCTAVAKSLEMTLVSLSVDR